MKRLFHSVFCIMFLCALLMIHVPAFADVAISSSNFPDSAFRSYISSNFDTDKDGKLSDSEISAVTVIDVSGQGITRMNGIERFTALEDLNFRNNNVSNIDLSKNINLVSLDCSSNYLTRLDVSKSSSLREIKFGGNKIATLNVSNTAITRLRFEDERTNITTVNAMNCNSLELVTSATDAWGKIGTLNLSGCSSLKRIRMFYYDRGGFSTIENLNLSGCSALENLSGGVPSLSELNMKSLNLSGCTSLVSLDVSGNELSALDLSTCTALQSLNCSNNNLPYLDLSANTALQSVNCASQKITASLSTKFDFKKIMASSKLSGIIDDTVHGFNSSGGMITTTFKSSSGVATFAYTPSEIDYEYSTGYGNLSMPVSISSSETPVQDDPPSITTSSLPDGNISSPYAVAMKASGMTPITWTLISGSLPAGLTLSTGGLITGTPSASGNYTFTIQAQNSIGSDSKTFTLSIGDDEVDSKPMITISSELDDAVVNSEYEVQLLASGTAPITWKITKGKLPVGLKLSASGLISGKATKEGKFSVTIRASNSYGDDTRTFTITSYTPPEITTNSIKNAKVGKPYTVPFTSKGTAPLEWKLDGNLPDGLTFDSSKRRITGTPTVNGTYKFTLTLSNAAGTASKEFELVVNAIAPKITTKSIPNGSTGRAYRAKFAATGTEPITWSIDGDLPDGLVFDSETGSITGTPTEMCNKQLIIITASNMEGEISKEFSLTIKGSAPSITTTKLPDGFIGSEYSTQITATGTSPITFTASGLPAGLTIVDDTITGIPTEAGKFKVIVTASNLMKTITKNLTLTITSPPIFNDGGILDEGTAGTSYSYTFDVSGTKTITYSISGGSLPDGITLNANAGTLRGRPTEAGIFDFTVTAKNSAGESSMTYSMMINAEAPKITGRFKSGTVGISYKASLKVSGTAPITWTLEGDLPGGLVFADGMIIGTPTEAFNGYVTVTASNPGGEDKKTYRLLVKGTNRNVSSSPEPEPEEYHEEQKEMQITPEIQNNDVQGFVLDGEYVVVGILSEVSVDVSGTYDFDVVLSDDAEAGEKLIWLAFPKDRETTSDDEIAEFYDESGAKIEVVPENRNITVSAWLTEGVIYEPVIAVKRKK